MIYAISVSRILDVVYAMSAITAESSDRPPVIGERREKALRRLTYHCACRLLPALSGIVRLSEEPDDPSEAELIYFEGNVCNGDPIGATLRIYLENALAAALMAAVWQETDPAVAQAYTAVVESNTLSLRNLSHTTDARIKPSF